MTRYGDNEVPLFPLQTVLFPGGPLPLRLFEARYTDMVGRCMHTDQPFGVVAIRVGHETGPSEIHTVGTLARIVDFYQGSDGLLGITAIGEQRFRLLSERTADDGLRIGTIERLPNCEPLPLPDDASSMAEILADVLDDLGKLYDGLERHFDDANWVGSRFCEILPLVLSQKQECLEVEDPMIRLRIAAAVLQQWRK
ncbi:MAG: LON peptidase substrate-binding domain-containing protein [Pseudomonadota bacterium]